jgi:hypothetical protein
MRSVYALTLCLELAIAAGCGSSIERAADTRQSPEHTNAHPPRQNSLASDVLVPPAHVESFHADFSHDFRANLHPHGRRLCRSGCAISDHPTGDLTAASFRRLLAEYASGQADAQSGALDTLVYFGRQSQQMLAQHGPSGLHESHVVRLKRELARSHARVSMRVIDGAEQTRVWMPPTRVPLDRRHEFRLDTLDVPPPTASGTVKRVGRDYLWARL